MNKPHFSEADLLETYYLEPCTNTDVLAHLERCGECADRYARLEEKVRSAATERVLDKPETFWARQKLSIIRRAEQRKAHDLSFARTFRVAAAAVIAFFLGGVVVYEAVEPGPNAPVERRSSSAAATADSNGKSEDPQTLRDPWNSDELDDFHNVVKWESWVESKNGGQS
jgi:anti-sigma factor RsiW